MKKRLSIAFVIIIIISIVFCGVFTTLSYRQSYFADAERNLEKNSHYIMNYLLPAFMETGNSENLSNFADSTELRLTVIDTSGEVIYESVQGLDAIENHKSRPEIIGALEGKPTSEIRYSKTIKDQMIYFAAPYYNNNNLEAVLRIALPLNAMDDAMFQMIENLVFIILVSILATILLVAYFINRELKPLDDASIFARKIASGKYGEKLTMIREDKVGELVESLNQMSSQLNDSFTEMDKKNDELTSILSSMNHGVIAIDNENHIIHLNEAARKVLKIPLNQKVIGKNILEIYRESFIFELMLHLENEENPKMSFESRINGNQFLRIYINRIVENNNIAKGHIIVLEDITFIKSLEKMRRDFIANVSHELKTPITSIKGFIETIQENNIKDEKTLKRFYGIISEESDRLSRLVNDILVLSHLENKGGLNEKSESLDLNREISQIFDILKLSAEAKGMTLKLDSKEQIVHTFNPDEFRQMMINLIDNAIKYSEINQSVLVKISQDKEEIKIDVKDHGYGIPEKDVSRIFERFYRVDKSRSKEKGGTGLGLAIVKHIIYNNHGSIEVNSIPGTGTVFTVHLPKIRD
ncbi:sensor histidine kinase [Acetobacterium bakii]|uniref:histidine kinase n=1 Tax=Acetobacterium bakii TaxID=52689 RepID=A0A0L6TZR6_9FIRM|nr:ATP-binding protein [Acetobacterium bakii]KNZ41060.1 histidine kinase [Acetobacterium bakii]